MSGAEAIGEVAQGALAARAVEPGHGEAADGHTHESACLNCDTPLVGSYCHACGQSAHVHRTLGAFFHDLLHGVFHFEGKVWRTLPALALRPGQMTREYIDGKRARYVSPVALFLFSVFLMFAVVKQFGLDLGQAADVSVNGRHVAGLEANQRDLDALKARRAELVKQGKPTDAIDGEIEGREAAITVLEELRQPVDAVAKQAAAPAQAVSSSDIPAIRDLLSKVRDNPRLALFQLQTNAYKFAWLLIPISVTFIWLLFPFSRRFGLYDHTVFVTYSLCFMMLLLSVLTLGNAAGLDVLLIGMGLIPPLHIYKQVRHAYGLSRAAALWRTAAMLVYAFAALSFFLMAVLALSAG
ncbi:DUF3667 domain-containing protein [Novosphingobium sp. TH158]|uniref:DUF3667 domain-containing protein n=1 Tax=Novosphingobium sp. TH158 TaxID=2067455 RepID=UPI000C7CDB9D|nr:DUF3667 domain-containing protein [Novosphingobium sp. TH158]PLK26881.1 hypothetical protein C0V78_08255 [Novosphingobium sp. TH158]